MFYSPGRFFPPIKIGGKRQKKVLQSVNFDSHHNIELSTARQGLTAFYRQQSFASEAIIKAVTRILAWFRCSVDWL
ncbi:hypothetical protein [Kalamiella sp. sgz302252]|uniref:hypothetical protein n=1 Tax=Pantoea sp. sgz302252 TaxID=3341827 RepID=UPI0036D3CEBE